MRKTRTKGADPCQHNVVAKFSDKACFGKETERKRKDHPFGMGFSHFCISNIIAPFKNGVLCRKLSIICLFIMATALVMTSVSFAENVPGTRRIDLGDEGEGVAGGHSPFMNDEGGYDQEDGFGDPFDADNDPMDAISEGEDNMGTTD